jgi:hypothetical protein
MKLLNKYVTNIPLLALVVANVIPLWGVLYLGWDAFHIVLLYWAENLIIGFYNILKMVLVKVPSLGGHLKKLYTIAVFIFHYSGFTAIHGLFVLALFNRGEGHFTQPGQKWPCFLIFQELLLMLIKYIFSVMPANMKYSLAALFLSHGASFAHHYVAQRQFASAKIDELMFAPYSRVVVMHIAIMAGAFFVMAIREPVAVLLALVALKTILDVKLHLREHRKSRRSQSAGQT